MEKPEDKVMNDIIFGKNSVMEALIAGNREINKILISKNIHTDNKINKIKELAQNKGMIFQCHCNHRKILSHQKNHKGDDKC